MTPARQLTTANGVEIAMEDECGSRDYSSGLAWISFNQLAISASDQLRSPLTFDYRKTGQTDATSKRAVSMLLNYARMMRQACVNYWAMREPDFAHARDHADLAIIALVDIGLHLEQPMSEAEFLDLVDAESARREALHLRGRKWFEY